MPDDPLAEWDWEAEEAELRETLAPEIKAAVALGILAFLLSLARAGVTLADAATRLPTMNELASAWAERYSFELVRGLTETTRTQLRAALSAYYSTPGMTRAQLVELILRGPNGIQDLQMGGRVLTAAQRAEWIASTELTRADTEALLIAGRVSGLRMVEPTEKPPKHTLCRCRISPFLREDGTLSWLWWTAQDELGEPDGKVCPICKPLHMQDVGAA
jgi:hypothetical protein